MPNKASVTNHANNSPIKYTPQFGPLDDTPQYPAKKTESDDESEDRSEVQFPEDDEVIMTTSTSERKWIKWIGSKSKSYDNIDTSSNSSYNAKQSRPKDAIQPKFKPHPHHSRFVNFLKRRKTLKHFSSVVSAANLPDDGASKDATNGPMNRLWNVQRLKHSTSSNNVTDLTIFTDSWIIREVTLQNVVATDTKFQAHLRQTYDDIDCSDVDPQEIYSIWNIKISPCGQWMIVGTRRGWIYLYEFSPDQPLGLLKNEPDAIFIAHDGSVIDLIWLPPSHDGIPMFISIGFDRRLCLWIADRCQNLTSVRTSEWCSSISLHPKDATQLYVGSLDATVQLWRLQIDSENRTARASMIDYVRVPDVVTAVSLTPDGSLIAVGVRRGSVAIYDSHTLRFITEIECHAKKSSRWKTQNQRVVGISWTDDNERLLVTTHDSCMRMISLNKESDARSIIKFCNHSLQYLLHKGYFFQPVRGRERILTASEDNNLYCYTPPLAEGGKVVHDHIKVSHQLITASAPTNRDFDRFLNSEVHKALTKSLGDDSGECSSHENEQMRKTPSYTAARWEHPKYFSCVFGTYSGSIKIFVNFGLER